MPRLPDYTDLGPSPVPQSRRGVASNPQAGAVGNALAGLGATVSDAGPVLQDHLDRAALASARARMLQSDVRLRHELRHDPDHTSWTARYHAGMSVARAEAGASIRHPSDRLQFEKVADRDQQRGAVEIERTARQRQFGQDLAALHETALVAHDEPTRIAAIDTVREAIAAAQANGDLDPERAGQLRRDWVRNYAAQRAELMGFAGEGATIGEGTTKELPTSIVRTAERMIDQGGVIDLVGGGEDFDRQTRPSISRNELGDDASQEADIADPADRLNANDEFRSRAIDLRENDAVAGAANPLPKPYPPGTRIVDTSLSTATGWDGSNDISLMTSFDHADMQAAAWRIDLPGVLTVYSHGGPEIYQKTGPGHGDWAALDEDQAAHLIRNVGGNEPILLLGCQVAKNPGHDGGLSGQNYVYRISNRLGKRPIMAADEFVWTMQQDKKGWTEVLVWTPKPAKQPDGTIKNVRDFTKPGRFMVHNGRMADFGITLKPGQWVHGFRFNATTHQAEVMLGYWLNGKVEHKNVPWKVPR